MESASFFDKFLNYDKLTSYQSCEGFLDIWSRCCWGL